MTKGKKTKIDDLVDQLIQSSLESRLSKLARRAKRKAVKESAKLKEYLQLPHIKNDEIVEAEVIEPQSAEDESPNQDIKKNVIG